MKPNPSIAQPSPVPSDANPVILGVIFDWDGVIIDSSKQHEKSWQRLSAEVNRPLPPDFFIHSFGMKNEVIIPRALNWTQDPDHIHELSLRKEALYRDIVIEDGIAPLPGVTKLMGSLREAGIPAAVGSSTHRENIETILHQIHLEGYFKAIVCSEDVTLGKPHPQVFLLAGERLGKSPEQCVVFEDAMVGVQAAKAAGMSVIALTTTHPKKYFQDADDIVCDLSEVKLEKMIQIVKKKIK